MKSLKVYLAFPVIVISISSASILVLLSNASALACAFWRVAISSIIIFILIAAKKRKLKPVNGRYVVFSIFSGFFLALHFLLWMESLFLVPVAVSTTIVVTYPLIAALIDKYVYNESISTKQTVGLVGAFLGVLLFTQPRILGDYPISGVLLSLGGAFAAAAYFSIGRHVRKNMDVLKYSLIAYSSSAMFLLVFSFVAHENLVVYLPRSFIYFLLLALIPMIGGHTLMNYILRFMKTSTVTSVALLEPIGATFLAYLILGQKIDYYKAIVMAIVLSTIMLTLSEEIKRKPS